MAKSGMRRRTQQEVADAAEKVAGAKGSVMRKAAETVSTRGTRSRLDAAEEEALGNGRKRR